MKSIEKALNILITQGVASNYVYPNVNSEFLTSCFDSGATIRNPWYKQTVTPVRFSFGTQKELDIFLKNNSNPYPLVWLVYPVSESYQLNKRRHHRFDRIRLIFAINTTTDKLIEERLQTTRYVLDQITDKFISLMNHSQYRKFIGIDKTTKLVETFHPNYSVNESQDKSKAIDVWDAMVLDCDINLIPDCIPNIINN